MRRSLSVNPQKRGKLSHGFWNSKAHQIDFLNRASKELGIKTLDDWYNVNTTKIRQLQSGASFLAYFKNSLYDALSNCYPAKKWIPWKFNYVSRGFWKDSNNRKQYFDWLATQLGLDRLDDWYKVKQSDIYKLGAGALLTQYYNTSLRAALRNVYPHHHWKGWDFEIMESGFWKNTLNVQEFLDWAESKLNIQKEEDWYHVESSQIVELGGKGLLEQHGSLFGALKIAKPDFNWIPWKFATKLPKGFWNEPHNISQFLAYASQELSITKLDDWYRVSNDHITKLGASSLIQKYGGIGSILSSQYPHHKWDLTKLISSQKRSSQRWLRVVVAKLFPKEELFEDYTHPQLTYHGTNTHLQFDIFVPKISLAFEYHGPQHYHDVEVFTPSYHRKLKDEEKRQACVHAGVTLIEIPYWWNRQSYSVAAAVIAKRPDLITAMEIGLTAEELAVHTIPETAGEKTRIRRRLNS